MTDKTGRKVSYQIQTINNPNPIARFAHRRRVNNSVNIVDKHARKGAVIVDFGAGDGYFIHLLSKKRNDLVAYGLEPYMLPLFDYNRLTDFDSLPKNSVDIVTAFEVCEHLYDYELKEFLTSSYSYIRDEGYLIVSVPIMYGVSVALKVINKMMLVRRTEYTVREIFSSLIGKAVSRPNDTKYTHKGFDFRELKAVLENKFYAKEELLSPFSELPWYLNSQIFFVCTKK